mmetsp:Transcript_24245/g.35631  ORF Transcript_24245/g.35631 Transcript_24245/m.35631 type:complete len:271 (-) Transcript_24245:42-854(-)
MFGIRARAKLWDEILQRNCSSTFSPKGIFKTSRSCRHIINEKQDYLTAKSLLIFRKKIKSNAAPRKITMGYGSTASPESSVIHDVERDFTSLDQSRVNAWFLSSPLEAVMLTSVILNAMAAGIIFIFSNTIMPTLATLDPDVGIYVMNTINDIIVNPLFVFIFFGGLMSAYPAVSMWKSPDKFSDPARYYALATTLVYFFGQFLVTVTQNVPRNDALQAVDSKSEDGVNYWTENYLKSWVAWNTARGVFALVSAILGALSLSLMRKASKK